MMATPVYHQRGSKNIGLAREAVSTFYSNHLGHNTNNLPNCSFGKYIEVTGIAGPGLRRECISFLKALEYRAAHVTVLDGKMVLLHTVILLNVEPAHRFPPSTARKTNNTVFM